MKPSFCLFGLTEIAALRAKNSTHSSQEQQHARGFGRASWIGEVRGADITPLQRLVAATRNIACAYIIASDARAAYSIDGIKPTRVQYLAGIIEGQRGCGASIHVRIGEGD